MAKPNTNEAWARGHANDWQESANRSFYLARISGGAFLGLGLTGALVAANQAYFTPEQAQEALVYLGGAGIAGGIAALFFFWVNLADRKRDQDIADDYKRQADEYKRKGE